MKKLLVIIAIVTLFLMSTGIALADDIESPGPATGYGDGVPNVDCLQYGPFGTSTGPGPAPNSGDGIHDGSGF